MLMNDANKFTIRCPSKHISITHQQSENPTVGAALKCVSLESTPETVSLNADDHSFGFNRTNADILRSGVSKEDKEKNKIEKVELFGLNSVILNDYFIVEIYKFKYAFESILTVLAWQFFMNTSSLQYGFVTLDWTVMSRAAVPFFDYGLLLKLDRENYSLYAGFHDWVQLSKSRIGEGLGIWRRGRLNDKHMVLVGRLRANILKMEDDRFLVAFEPNWLMSFYYIVWDDWLLFDNGMVLILLSRKSFSMGELEYLSNIMQLVHDRFEAEPTIGFVWRSALVEIEWDGTPSRRRMKGDISFNGYEGKFRINEGGFWEWAVEPPPPMSLNRFIDMKTSNYVIISKYILWTMLRLNSEFQEYLENPEYQDDRHSWWRLLLTRVTKEFFARLMDLYPSNIVIT
jgi:hypothetical protein